MLKRVVDIKQGDLLWVGPSEFGAYMEVSSVRWLKSSVKVWTKSLTKMVQPSSLSKCFHFKYTDSVEVLNAD